MRFSPCVAACLLLPALLSPGAQGGAVAAAGPTAEECAAVTEKNAQGDKLTPAEGDMLLACVFISFDPEKGFMLPYPTPDGFIAHEMPPLYDEQDILDYPGILGGGMVNG